MYERVVKTKKSGHPLISKMPHESLATAIEMHEFSAALKEIVLACINITQRFVQLLGRAKGLKERFSWLCFKDPYIDTLILFEFFSLMHI